jgi:hypothetical protein
LNDILISRHAPQTVPDNVLLAQHIDIDDAFLGTTGYEVYAVDNSASFKWESMTLCELLYNLEVVSVRLILRLALGPR